MIYSIQGLSARQRLILEAIIGMSAANGYPPSLAELRHAVGLSSQNALRCHLMVLRRKGFVDWEDGRARTIRVLDGVEEKAKAFLAGNTSGVAAAYRTRASAEERVAKENGSGEEDWDIEEVPLYA